MVSAEAPATNVRSTSKNAAPFALSYALSGPISFMICRIACMPTAR